MQILHPFLGSAQQYTEEVSHMDRYRPDHCPQCQARQPLTGHGFYRRTLVDVGFDESIRVRRYLCRSCQRTVSLLPHFALPISASVSRSSQRDLLQPPVLRILAVVPERVRWMRAGMSVIPTGATPERARTSTTSSRPLT